MTFIDVVYPCVETLIFSARKIHLFLFSYSCQHYLFRYVAKGFALGSSIYWMFRYPGEALAFSWPNFGILLRPVTFSMPYWNRLRPFWPLSYYAFIKRWLLPSLLHGCFFKEQPSHTGGLLMTILISLSKHKNNLCPIRPLVIFWYFGTFILVLGCFPFDSGPYQPLSDYLPLILWFF